MTMVVTLMVVMIAILVVMGMSTTPMVAITAVLVMAPSGDGGGRSQIC